MRFLAIVLGLLALAAAADAALLRGAGSIAGISSGPTCPANTQCALVHNAAGWQASHAYAPATPPTRVNNGPGWTAGSPGTWNPGSTLRNYQLTSGSCTSAASGGPTGTGAAITDGTCTWKYVSDVDYVSITGWVFDAAAWAAATYTYRDYVVSDTPLSAYALETGQSGPGGTCASTVAPTGTGTPSPASPTSSGPTSTGTNNIVTMSDSCQWRWMGYINYTSKKAFTPHQKWIYNGTNVMVPGTYNLTQNYQAFLYNDQEYVAGSNGENAPISICGHTDLTACYSTPELTNSETCVGQSTGVDSSCYEIVLTTAPGESFRDKLTSGTALAGYDITKGVAISNSTVYPGLFGGANMAVGLLFKDQWLTVSNIQIKSTNSYGIDAYNYHANFARCISCIIDGGAGTAAAGSYPALTFDAGPSVLADSLIVSRGSVGVFAKYDAKYLDNTIVAPGSPATSLCIAQYWTGFGIPNGTTAFGNLCFGFTHATAGLDGSQGGNGTAAFLSDSDHNATDVASTDNTGSVQPGFPSPSQIYDLVAMPGAHSLYSQSAASVFVAPYTDMREANSSPSKAAGGAYGTFARYCRTSSPTCAIPPYPGLNFDTPDIIGTTRPGSGGTDIGAWQAP